MGEGVEEIAVGLFLEALQGHGTAGGITEQAFQLITPVRGDLGVGVQGNPCTLAQWGSVMVERSPFDAACDYLVDVVLTGRGANDGMDLGGEVL
jgi:hypothetical protein